MKLALTKKQSLMLHQNTVPIAARKVVSKEDIMAIQIIHIKRVKETKEGHLITVLDPLIVTKIGCMISNITAISFRAENTSILEGQSHILIIKILIRAQATEDQAEIATISPSNKTCIAAMALA